MRGLVLAACALLATGGAALAEKPVQRFVCVFDRHVSPETNGIAAQRPLRFEFMVDATGHAFAVGQFVVPIKVITGDSAITFLEVLKTGGVQSTTMNKSGDAVHSRHTLNSITGKFIPSQNYGTCK